MNKSPENSTSLPEVIDLRDADDDIANNPLMGTRLRLNSDGAWVSDAEDEGDDEGDEGDEGDDDDDIDGMGDIAMLELLLNRGETTSKVSVFGEATNVSITDSEGNEFESTHAVYFVRVQNKTKANTLGPLNILSVASCAPVGQSRAHTTGKAIEVMMMLHYRFKCHVVNKNGARVLVGTNPASQYKTMVQYNSKYYLVNTSQLQPSDTTVEEWAKQVHTHALTHTHTHTHTHIHTQTYGAPVSDADRRMFNAYLLAYLSPDYEPVSSIQGETGEGEEVLKMTLAQQFYDVITAPVGSWGEKCEEFRADNKKGKRPYWGPRLENRDGSVRPYYAVKVYAATQIIDEQRSWTLLRWQYTQSFTPESEEFVCGPYSNGGSKSFKADKVWAIGLGRVIGRHYTSDCWDNDFTHITQVESYPVLFGKGKGNSTGGKSKTGGISKESKGTSSSTKKNTGAGDATESGLGEITADHPLMQMLLKSFVQQTRTAIEAGRSATNKTLVSTLDTKLTPLRNKINGLRAPPSADDITEAVGSHTDPMKATLHNLVESTAAIKNVVDQIPHSQRGPASPPASPSRTRTGGTTTTTTTTTTSSKTLSPNSFNHYKQMMKQQEKDRKAMYQRQQQRRAAERRRREEEDAEERDLREVYDTEAANRMALLELEIARASSK